MRSVFKKYLHITSLRRKMILSFSALLISALAILQAANTYQTYTVLEENFMSPYALGFPILTTFLKTSITWLPVFYPKLRFKML